MNQRQSDDLGLGEYLAVIRRRWRWVAVTVIVVLGLVTAFTLARDEEWRSTSVVLILTQENRGVFDIRNEALYRDAIAEIQYMQTRSYENAVEEVAGFEVDLSAQVRLVASAEKPEAAGLIQITNTATSQAEAVAGANAAAEVYLEQRSAEATLTLERTRRNQIALRDRLIAERTEFNRTVAEARAAAEDAPTALDQLVLGRELELLIAETSPEVVSLSAQIGQYNSSIAELNGLISVLEGPNALGRIAIEANVPDAPESPNVTRNILLGAAIGLILGLLFAVWRDLLDPRVGDGAELAELVEVPVIATISPIRRQRSAPGRVRRYCDMNAVESAGYQLLLNSLWLKNLDEPLQSIVVTSDRPGVGKTQTVVNLAQAEAARGTKVLVIDADFVSPSVAARLDMEPAVFGFADLLRGTVSIEQAVVDSEIENLHVVDAEPDKNASDLLRSDRLRSLLADLYGRYDLVLIDSPPTLSTSDSRLVASQADAVVVVYDPAISRREALQRTIELLRDARANLAGLVANRSRSSHSGYVNSRGRESKEVLYDY